MFQTGAHSVSYMAPASGSGRALLAVALIMALASARAGAQTPEALGSSPPTRTPPATRVTGGVINLQSQTPIAGAQVALLGTAFVTASDSTGRFAYAGVAAGTYLLQVRAIGYDSQRWIIQLAAGDTVDYQLELTPLGVELAPVIIEGRPAPFQVRLQEFEQRRAAKRGVFLTAEDIRATKAATMVDALRGVPGVRIACRSGTCVVEMMRSARGLCRADWVVDGFPASQSGTPHLPTVGIVGVEVYRSPNETPTEFLKSDSQCGVVVIWTRSSL